MRNASIQAAAKENILLTANMIIVHIADSNFGIKHNMNQKQYIEWIKEKEQDFRRKGYDNGTITSLVGRLETIRHYVVMKHLHPEFRMLYDRVLYDRLKEYSQIIRNLEVRVEMPQWRGDYLNGRVEAR